LKQREHADSGRYGELTMATGERRTTPSDERTNPGEREQRQAERHIHLVEEGRLDRDLRALNQLRENGEQRPPQHRKRDSDEQQVIEQETGLTAHHRLELGLRGEQRETDRVQGEAGRGGHDEEREEEVAHAR